MFYFDHSRYIDLKKDRRDFAKQIYPAFKWKKKKKKKTQSLLEDAAEHAVYRGSWIKYSSESIRAEAEDTPYPFLPFGLRELWYVSGYDARSSPIQHASNIHEFIRSAELLSATGSWRTLTGRNFHRCIGCLMIPVSEG